MIKRAGTDSSKILNAFELCLTRPKPSDRIKSGRCRETRKGMKGERGGSINTARV